MTLGMFLTGRAQMHASAACTPTLPPRIYSKLIYRPATVKACALCCISSDQHQRDKTREVSILADWQRLHDPNRKSPYLRSSNTLNVVGLNSYINDRVVKLPSSSCHVSENDWLRERYISQG
jgi:hypothetical protein